MQLEGSEFEEIENLEAITSKEEEKSQFREKRRYPRIDYIFQVKYELLPSATHQEELSSGKDLSLGGVSFEIKETIARDIQIGNFLVIKFSIPEIPGELKAMGKVVRIWEDTIDNQKKQFCAIKFTAIDPTDYEILNNFITDYLKIYSQKNI